MVDDKFANNSVGVESPAVSAFAVTPSDTVDLAFVTRAFYVGSDGNVKVTTVNGDTVIFYGCVAGSIYPVRVKRVYLTGTTAAYLVGLY